MKLTVTVKGGSSITVEKKVYKLSVWPSGLKFLTTPGQSVILENISATSMEYGDVVRWAHTPPKNRVALTGMAANTEVAGVAQATILPNSLGPIATFPGHVVEVKCTTDAVAIGDFLQTSTVTTRAITTGIVQGPATFAKALTSKAAGLGTVWALLLPVGGAAAGTGKDILVGCFIDAVSLFVANGVGYVTVPKSCNLLKITRVAADVITPGTTNATLVALYSITNGANILTAPVSIASAETRGLSTAINSTYATLTAGDRLRVDVTQVSTTPPKGLSVEISLEKV